VHRLSPILHHHLRHNHYPPVPFEVFPWVVKAIEMGRSDEEVVVHHGGDDMRLKITDKFATANLLIEAFHLDDFLEEEDD
jgi:hypothetical protein